MVTASDSNGARAPEFPVERTWVGLPLICWRAYFSLSALLPSCSRHVQAWDYVNSSSGARPAGCCRRRLCVVHILSLALYGAGRGKKSGASLFACRQCRYRRTGAAIIAVSTFACKKKDLRALLLVSYLLSRSPLFHRARFHHVGVSFRRVRGRAPYRMGERWHVYAGYNLMGGRRAAIIRTDKQPRRRIAGILSGHATCPRCCSYRMIGFSPNCRRLCLDSFSMARHPWFHRCPLRFLGSARRGRAGPRIKTRCTTRQSPRDNSKQSARLLIARPC